jgi:hypothetical protein
VTLSVRVARYAFSEALWNGSSMRDETTGIVVTTAVDEVVDDVEVDDVALVVVVATTDVEDFGCCAPKESRLVSIANPAADARMTTVATTRLSTT